MNQHINQPNSAFKTTGFTLLELLVVVGLIGIVLMMALPSFDGTAGLSKLDAAANAVHSAAKAARQYALSHQQPTYLVFQDETNADPPENAYRAYAIFTININKPMDQAITQTDGTFIKDWEILPTGIVFDNVCGGDSNVFDYAGSSWNAGFDDNNRLYIEGTNSAGNGFDYSVLGFTTKGKPHREDVNAARTPTIFCCEGFYADDGSIQHTSKQSRQIILSKSGHSLIQKRIYNDAGEPE